MYREQLLFVCSRNQWRSLTVAVLFKDLEVIEKRGWGVEIGGRLTIDGLDKSKPPKSISIRSIAPPPKTHNRSPEVSLLKLSLF